MTDLAIPSSPSPYRLAHDELKGLGYHVIPIIPASASDQPGRGKAPGEYRGGAWRGMAQWQRFRDRAPTQFETELWARNFPDANAGIVLGSDAGQGTHLIAIDIDATDEATVEHLCAHLPYATMAKRGAKGRTLFYRAPNTIRTATFDLIQGDKRTRLADLLTGFDTRQTVIPPSAHANGVDTYTWLLGPVPARMLPLFDQAALDRFLEGLRAVGWEPKSAKRQTTPAPQSPGHSPSLSDGYWADTKQFAMDRLSAWVPALGLYNCEPARGGYAAVAHWRSSSTGRPLSERKRNLSIQPNGIKDFGTGETYTAIDLVMTALGLSMDEATEWLRDRLGISTPIVFMPPPPAPAAAPDLEPDETDEGEMPADFARVDGLVGALYDWIMSSARKPQPALALGAAIAIVGTLAGRIYAGPTGLGTHLYVLGLAPTGAGKDHCLSAPAALFGAANLMHLLGPSEFMSKSSIYTALGQHPCMLAPLDEFGAALAKINSRKASTHEAGITSILRTAWGANWKLLPGQARVQGQGKAIFAPALSVLGVSTHAEFYAALRGADLSNGLFNRFLLFSSLQRPDSIAPKVGAQPPQALVDWARTIREPIAAHAVAIASADANGQPFEPLVRIPYDDARAQKVERAIEREVNGLADGDEQIAAIMVRVLDQALRLASIAAIGRDGPAARITQDDMLWGRKIALWSGKTMLGQTKAHMAENDHQSAVKRVLAIIRGHPDKDAEGWITHRQVTRALDHVLKVQELKGAYEMLADAGLIERQLVRHDGGGRPTERFRAT